MDQAQIVRICLPEQASANEPERAPIGGSRVLMFFQSVTELDVRSRLVWLRVYFS
jgi:hypothetical protein